MFHNMEYVYAVYRERSFSKAAEKLHVSQPALSATVRKVEERAGSAIFERKTRPISLTPFGVEYIQSVEQIYELEEGLQQMAYDLQTLQSGHLAIGGSNLDIPYLVPRRIAEFQRAYPRVGLQIVEDSTVGCKTLLDNGELDLIVTNRPLDTEVYHRLPCYREVLVLVVPAGYSVNEPLTGKALSREERCEGIFQVPEERCVSLAEVAGAPMVLLHDGNYLRLCTDMIFREDGVEPNVVLEVQKSAVAYTFASLGVGATIVSNVLLEGFHCRDLCIYKLRSPRALREAYLCYRKGRRVTPAMRRFIQMMTQDLAAENGPAAAP